MDAILVIVLGISCTAVFSEELYMTTPESILRIDTSTLQTSAIVTKENGRLFGLAADWQNERLYYTDVFPNGGGIYTANLQGGDVRKLPIQYPDMEPVGLAVDWVYGHLYWTDTVYRAVMMSNLDGTGRVTIVTENLIIPRGVAVDPERRELYIGDQGKHAVQMCGLDGRYCRELNVTDGITTFWPNQIAIDFLTKKVHWTDGWVPAVYSCSAGGIDCQRKTGNLSNDIGTNPAFGIAIGHGGSELFVSTLHNQSLYRSNLDLELTKVDIDASSSIALFLLRRETASDLPSVVTSNPCATNKGGCSDICVPHPGDTFTCLCPDGSGKLPVNKVCQTPTQFLLFTDITKGTVAMAKVDDPKVQTTIMRAVKPLAVTYHQSEKKVYFADARTRAIYKCNLDGSGAETLLDSSHGVGQVEGMSIDYNQNRLYFSNMGFEEYEGVLRSWHTIEMVDLDSKRRRTILTSLEKPRAVVVDSNRRVLYYTDWGSTGHVGKVSLDGSNRVVLTTAENPNDLTISDNKLLIINNKQPTAELIEIDLTTINGGESRRQLSNVEPLSVSKSGDNLLVSSFTGGVNIYNKLSLARTFGSSFGQFTRMIVVDTTSTVKKDVGICSESDTCSDICVTSQNSNFISCLCQTNKFNQLTNDRLSCEKPNSYILFADIDGIKMAPQGNTEDNHVYTIIYPSANCSHFYGLVVDENQQYIYFSALQGKSVFRAKVDGSNMQRIVTDPNGKITSLALVGSDLFWTSGNITDNSTGAILHVSLNDPKRTVNTMYVTQTEPLDIVADESNIYWTEKGALGGVMRFDRRQSMVRSPVFSGQTSAITLTVPSRHLLFATKSDVVLRRFPALGIGMMSSNTLIYDYMSEIDTIEKSGVNTMTATSQFLYLSRWWTNSTGSITRHDLTTKQNYDVTNSVVRPGQMVYVSNQERIVQDKAGTCPSVDSCSTTACFLDVDCYGSSKCCGTSRCTRCSAPEKGPDCIKDGVVIGHSGGAVKVGCEKCSCFSGNLTCVPIFCPDLGSCPEENRIQPSGTCCPICTAIKVCSSPPTIENCPTSTKSFLLPKDSKTMNVNLEDIISTKTYGKSCSGQTLNLNYTETSLKFSTNKQTLTVSSSDRHGTATCTVSIQIIDDTKPVFDSCSSGILQLYITENNRVVTWPPVTARDNSGVVTLTTDSKNGIERSPGLYNVIYKAEDESRNFEYCAFAINVTTLQECKSPPIPFNGFLRCKDTNPPSCKLEKCDDGYVNTLTTVQNHVCDKTSGEWVPPFPSNFSNACIKPEPLYIQRDYYLEFNCSNDKFDASDLQQCISNARLCPENEIKLCEQPFQRTLNFNKPDSVFNITMNMEGKLQYGSDMVGLISRMHNVGNEIEDFLQTKDFETKCPQISCPFTQATFQPDTRRCDIGSRPLYIGGNEICAPCPIGWFYSNGDCVECPANTYQERTGKSSCTPCPEQTTSRIGSFLRTQCKTHESFVETESINISYFIIAPVVIGIILILVAAFAIVFFYLKRRRVSQTYSPGFGKFENPIFLGDRNEAFAMPSVEEYDQFPMDKQMFSETQSQKFESKESIPREVETELRQRPSVEPKWVSNNGFQDQDYSHMCDFDSPNERLLDDIDLQEDNEYNRAQRH